MSCKKKERGKRKPGDEQLFMPSEQAALARLTSLLEFGSGTGRSGTTPEGRHRAVSYTIIHLMDEEIRGRVGARRKVAYGEAT